MSHQTFNKLVENDADFIGMVAYTIYKKDKLDWIEQFKVRNPGSQPTYADISAGFNVASDSPAKIAAYRSMAETKLNEFMDNTLAEEISDYRTSILQEETIKRLDKLNTDTIQKIDTLHVDTIAKVDTVKTRNAGDVWFNIWTGWLGASLIALVSVFFTLYKVVNDPKALAVLTELMKTQ